MAIVKAEVEAAYICIHTFPSAKHVHTLFWKGGFSEPRLQRPRDHFFSCASGPCGRPRLPGSVDPLFPQLQQPDVPPCKDVLLGAFTLDVTILLCKHERNWMFLAFLTGELGEHSAWLILPPTPCLFPNGVLAKSISCGQVTHWNLCSTPGVHCLKAGASPNSVREESLLWPLYLAGTFHWEQSCHELGQIRAPHSWSSCSFIFSLRKVDGSVYSVDFQDCLLMECDYGIYLFTRLMRQPLGECLLHTSSVLGAIIIEIGLGPCSQNHTVWWRGGHRTWSSAWWIRVWGMVGA